MPKSNYIVVTDRHREERKQIWRDGSAFGKRAAYNEMLTFIKWFNKDYNKDLSEIEFYIESRLSPKDTTAVSAGFEIVI